MKIASFLLVFLYVQVSIAAEQYSISYDPKRDPFADGRAAIALATKTNRRILIEVGGDWCKWCHLLNNFINTDPLIRKERDKIFVVLKVNVSDENSNEKFLASFPNIQGYPHMFVTESNGDVIHSQDTAKFLQNSKYSKEKILSFINKWKVNSQ